MSGILYGLADVLDVVFRLYLFCVLIAVILSLVQADPWNPVVRFFRRVTEPVFFWIRRRFPFVVVEAFDLSPLVIWLTILFLQYALVGNLRHLAARSF